MFTARRAAMFMAAGALLTLFTVGGWQLAERALAAPSGVISGCYQGAAQGNGDDRGKGDGKNNGSKGDDTKNSDENTGALRIVGSASDCRKNETFIQWSQQGASGATGAAGATGAKGDVGNTGPTASLPSVSCPSGQFLTGIVGGVAQCVSPSPPPPAPPSGYTLTLVLEGVGTVTSSPAGISCGTRVTVLADGSVVFSQDGTCSATFPAGSNVDLSAQPGLGGSFNLWSEACAGLQPHCIVSMTGAKTVGASFSTVVPPPQQPALLTVLPTSSRLLGPNEAQQFTVTNQGEVSSGPLTVTIDNLMHFFVVPAADMCTFTVLTWNSTCSFLVEFSPAGGTPGTEVFATVTVAANPGGSRAATLAGRIP